MLLNTELIRRELRLLTARAQSFQSLPSGTQGRRQLTRVSAQQQIVQGGTPSRTSGEGQPKPGRRHTVHRKWALSRVFAPSINRYSKKSFYSHLQKQTALHFPRGHQEATVIRPLRGSPYFKTKIPGTLAATRQTNPHALLIRHFTQLGREHNYENTNRRGLVGAKAPTT
jgi:hypothetical protein